VGLTIAEDAPPVPPTRPPRREESRPPVALADSLEDDPVAALPVESAADEVGWMITPGKSPVGAAAELCTAEVASAIVFESVREAAGLAEEEGRTITLGKIPVGAAAELCTVDVGSTSVSGSVRDVVVLAEDVGRTITGGALPVGATAEEEGRTITLGKIPVGAAAGLCTVDVGSTSVLDSVREAAGLAEDVGWAATSELRTVDAGGGRSTLGARLALSLWTGVCELATGAAEEVGSLLGIVLLVSSLSVGAWELKAGEAEEGCGRATVSDGRAVETTGGLLTTVVLLVSSVSGGV
jgi:hypothetical protein